MLKINKMLSSSIKFYKKKFSYALNNENILCIENVTCMILIILKMYYFIYPKINYNIIFIMYNFMVPVVKTFQS